MGKPTGFLEHERELPRRRPVPVRLRDWREVSEPFDEASVRTQASRCMDCGIPFCHEGCPLGNLIPEWNDLTYRGDWYGASERLHATNNFPEMTGRLCPAPCEAACVLGISREPVTIERIELEIAERAWREGWVVPHPALTAPAPAPTPTTAPATATHTPPATRTPPATHTPPATRTSVPTRVAVVGSGPAGLACAQQLARAGHEVTVYERAERPGGLLRYGIPEFKMEKHVLDRRLAQLRAEGVRFVCKTSVGESSDAADPGCDDEPRARQGACAPDVEVVSARQLREEHDALVLATGATIPRDLSIPGRELAGVHFALEYLKPANLVQEGALAVSPLDARGKRVVIVGGGDTGADCLGTAHRQGAASVLQLEILPEPPRARSLADPWPLWPVILRTSAAHEEGGARRWSVTPTALVGDAEGHVAGLRCQEVVLVEEGGRRDFQPVPGSEHELPCDLVLLAMGFVGPERRGAVAELGLELTARGTVALGADWSTGADGVFACGDAARGQSLVVWAIAEGRSAAAAVDRWLRGETALPAPITPGQMAMR